MTTIPQVARAMREILTTIADAAARTTQFVVRRSPLGGATFSQTLVFGFLGNPEASLEELTQTAAALGVAITPQALDQRCTEAAAACLKQVLHAALTRALAHPPRHQQPHRRVARIVRNEVHQQLDERRFPRHLATDARRHRDGVEALGYALALHDGPPSARHGIARAARQHQPRYTETACS